MTTRIGRKSTFARDIQNIKEPLNNVKEGVLIDKEVIPGIVLDVLSSYKQKSCFIDKDYRGYKNFTTGIFFLVGLYDEGDIAVVSWRKSEDELRTIYGTDENIIGRECVVICNKKSPEAYLKGEVVFNKSLDSGIKSYKGCEYMSNSFFANVSTNFADQLKSENPQSQFGETWRKVKLP